MAGKNLPTAIAVCLMLGCASNKKEPELSAEIGSGPIVFSVSSTATFRYYSKKKRPKVFVVSIDGERGFYTYCPADWEVECRENTSGLLLEYCEERSEKVCKVFAKNGRVVWRNPGAWQSDERIGMHFFVDHRGVESHKL